MHCSYSNAVLQFFVFMIVCWICFILIFRAIFWFATILIFGFLIIFVLKNLWQKPQYLERVQCNSANNFLINLKNFRESDDFR